MSDYGTGVNATRAELRDYQQRGVDWMLSLHRQGSGGILADEMGLGKTLQVIQFLRELCLRRRIYGPHLVVVPLSVITSWRTDLQKFGGDAFAAYVHHEDKNARHKSFVDWYHALKRKRKLGTQEQISLFITTYEVAIKDEQLLSKLSRGSLRWEYLVVDEAHRLKNKSSILFEVLSSVHCSARRLLLTGTPLQNNLAELWSLLHFTLPGRFTTEMDVQRAFEQHFEHDSDVEDTVEEQDDMNGVEESSGKGTGLAIVGSGRSSGVNAVADKTSTDDRRNRRTQKGAYYSRLFRFVNGDRPVADSLSDGAHPRTTTTVRVGGNGNDCGLMDDVERKKIVRQLHILLKPYILRRLKADVALELPPKVEKVVYCPLSALQREVYQLFRARVEESHRQRDTPSKRRKYGVQSDAYEVSGLDVYGPYTKALDNVNNLLMQLRKLCNHPYLVLEDIQTVPDTLYYDQLLISSGKLFVLDRLLSSLLPQGCKVLIFSQMTSMLDILQGYLQDRGIRTARLDGSTAPALRERQLRDFSRSRANTPGQAHSPLEATSQDGPEYSVFLLSTRAGGVGINLQAADTVILYDSDWNPQQDLQAISRAHRIGQTKPVLVLRLVSTGPDERTYSVEQRILRRAARKLEAERQVLARGLFDHSAPAVDSHCKAGAASTTAATTDGPLEDPQGSNDPDEGGASDDGAAGAAEGVDSFLALFETITDTESVSSAEQQSAPSGSILTNSLSNMDSLVNVKSTLSNAATAASQVSPVRSKSVHQAIVDMYALDFTASGIERICQRGDAATLPVAAKASNEDAKNVIDRELLRMMKELRVDDWRSWLYPAEIDSMKRDSRRPVESPGQAVSEFSWVKGGSQVFSTPTEVRRSSQRCTPSDRSGGDAPASAARAHGGDSAQKRARVNYSEDALWETMLPELARKRRGATSSDQGRPAVTPRSNRPRRRCRGARSPSDDTSSEEEEEEEEGYGESHPNDDSENSGSDSPDGTSDVDDKYAQSSGGRSRGHLRSGARAGIAHGSKRRPRVAADVALAEDDICAICGQAWVTAREVDVYIECVVQQQLRSQGSDGIVEDGAPPPLTHKGVVGNGVRGASDQSALQRKALPTADTLNMMILCDGCDGSFHMICAGVEELQEGEWFCQLCNQL